MYGKMFKINKPTKSCFASRAKPQSQIVFVTIVGHNMSGLTPTFAPNVGPKGLVCELVVSYLKMIKKTRFLWFWKTKLNFVQFLRATTHVIQVSESLFWFKLTCLSTL